MKALMNKLKYEANLTEEQAFKAVSVIRDYMKSKEMISDWKDFFENKYKEIRDEVGEQLGESAEQLKKKAQEAAKDLSDRLDEFSQK